MSYKTIFPRCVGNFTPCLQAVGPHTTTLLPKGHEKVADVHSKPTGGD